MSKASKEQSRAAEELLELRAQIQETRSRIVRANNYFNFVRDPVLVEACVLEMKALEKRYEYLLRTYREIAAPHLMQSNVLGVS